MSLDNILRLRLRDGFMIRNIKFMEKSRDRTEMYIVAEMCLPWKEQITIVYKVTSPWPNYTERFVCFQFMNSAENEMDSEVFRIWSME